MHVSWRRYPRVTSFVGVYYGTTRVAERHWASLAQYTSNLVGHAVSTWSAPGQHLVGHVANESVATCDEFSDWVTAGVCDSGMCPALYSPKCESKRCPVGEEMAGFSYVLGLRAMASMAGQLGQPDQARRYASRAVQFYPTGGQFDFVWLSARAPHEAYAWCLAA